jgi:hypothetical protein
VFERFAQRQSALMLEQAEERVSLELGPPPPASAAAAAAAQSPQLQHPPQLLSVRIRVSSTPPVLRSLHFTRTAGSGSAPESLIRGLLQHMDLDHTWKLRGCEGLPSHFWAACADATAWGCLFNLNLSSCGLAALPAAVGQLASLHVVRLNHNKLTSLPPELGQLTELEVLSVNHNQVGTEWQQADAWSSASGAPPSRHCWLHALPHTALQLTTLPAELRRCKALRELHLEYNRLATPVLDLSNATALESLQVGGGEDTREARRHCGCRLSTATHRGVQHNTWCCASAVLLSLSHDPNHHHSHYTSSTAIRWSFCQSWRSAAACAA